MKDLATESVGLLFTMRGEQDRRFWSRYGDDFYYAISQRLIQALKWFVKQKEVWCDGERACDGYTLLHAARERGRKEQHGVMEFEFFQP